MLKLPGSYDIKLVTGGLIFVSYHRDQDSISIIKSVLYFFTVSSPGKGGESKRCSNSSPRAGYTFMAEPAAAGKTCGKLRGLGTPDTVNTHKSLTKLVTSS